MLAVLDGLWGVLDDDCDKLSGDDFGFAFRHNLLFLSFLSHLIHPFFLLLSAHDGRLGPRMVRSLRQHCTNRRVIGTSCLIAFIAYSSQIFIIWPWYGSVLSVDLLKLLVPFK